MTTDHPRTAKRRPGRPRSTRRDQRDRLLGSALQVFSSQGIAATSLSAIARHARVTPALVHYYFGDRDALLDAMVEERIRPLIEAAMGTPGLDSSEPRELLRGFVQSVGALLVAHPWLPPLYVREVLSDGGLLRDRVIGGISMPIAQRLSEALRGAQRNGRLAADLDPRLLLVSVIALTLFPFAAMPIWRRIFDAGDITPAQMIDHTIALLERGIGLP